MHSTRSLNLLLGDLIEFEDTQKRRFGTIAKDAAIGGAASAVGTAGLLAGGGMLLKKKAPDLARMLHTASGQHVKVFNPLSTIPMMRSLPEASRLFGKQLRVTKEVENLALRAKGGKLPSIRTLRKKYQQSGINPSQHLKEVAGFKRKWGKTPGQTMEKSIGLLSGMAAAGAGVAGGAALSKGWEVKKKELSSLLSDLIEFKLFQPKRGDESPEDLPRLTPGTLADYNVQRHEAKRAGLHRDVRIGTKRHGLVSWATRKDLPREGGKIAVHPQPVHPHSYLGWEGDIPSGYGAGKVSTETLGKALITKSSPTEVHATLAGQREHHRLAFLKTAKGWLLTRGKHPVPPKEAQKPKYKSVSPEKAHEHLSSIEPGTIVQPKIDGALVYVTTKGNRPEIFSHRVSKQTGKHIVHTERFFRGRPATNIPKEHQRTLIGELYGIRKGKAVPPQELGGILNTHLGESISKQKTRGIKLKIMPFDYADGKGEPYPERLEKVKATLRHLPKGTFHPPEEAKTPGAAHRLFNKIRHGLHPLTQEGVIVHPPKGRMVKIKNVQEENVKISGTFPGSGKFEGSHGGFVYSDKKGKVLGHVGTGFTDESRRTLHKYVGRTARIRHQGKYPSGAYRAPSFIAVEENK